jgi:hypothetical protein
LNAAEHPTLQTEFVDAVLVKREPTLLKALTELPAAVLAAGNSTSVFGSAFLILYIIRAECRLADECRTGEKPLVEAQLITVREASCRGAATPSLLLLSVMHEGFYSVHSLFLGSTLQSRKSNNQHISKR